MSNSWWEIVVLCDPVLEESVYWRLDRFGCKGTATETKGQHYSIRGYISKIEAENRLSSLFSSIREDAANIGAPEPEMDSRSLEEEDWASSWKKHWQPTPVSDRFLIYPAWLESPSDSERIILRLDPGAAFGTGTHPTTQLCLESLEMRLQFPKEPPILADIGCGSGILSIGAILLGAQKVYAVDTDPLAVKATTENCQLNKIKSDRVVVERGSFDKLKELHQEAFDGIICNISAEVVKEIIPRLKEISHQDTWGILSGTLVKQAQEIAELLEANGWIVATLWKQQEWCCFNIRRDDEDW